MSLFRTGLIALGEVLAPIGLSRRRGSFIVINRSLFRTLWDAMRDFIFMVEGKK